MVQNIIGWDSQWEHAQRLAESLKKAEAGGTIKRLCFMPGGRACFRSRERADKLLYDLSWQCGGKVISHDWLDGEDCGSCLWQEVEVYTAAGITGMVRPYPRCDR